MAQLHDEEHLVPVNNINLNYVDHGGDGPMLLLLHGLTANGHAFDGLMADGLGERYHVICPDMRGNGLSDKPAFCYTVEEHVQDILGLIKHLGKEKIYLGGHSFGGYMAFYLAANYPDVVERLVIMDAAKAMNPKAVEMLSKAISRLEATYHSFNAYIEHVKKAPYLTFWDPAMLSYYRADVEDLPKGHVTPRANLMAITEKSLALSTVDWETTIPQIKQHTLLINALDNYTMGEPLLPDYIAKETVEMMPHATYEGVDGNHQTMLYGEGAKEIVAAINEFLPV